MHVFLKIFALSVLVFLSNNLDAKGLELDAIYRNYERKPGDIHQHLKHLRRLAKDSDSVLELGVRNMVSTFALLAGLSENEKPVKVYVGVDLSYPPQNLMRRAYTACKDKAIDLKFVDCDDALFDPMDVDLLFIDSLHTYAQLSFELEKFSPKVRKYIAMHDTDAPWGFEDEPNSYGSENSSNLKWADPTKKGLLIAVKDFLYRHPEWQLQEHYKNCHGFTVLTRKSY